MPCQRVTGGMYGQPLQWSGKSVWILRKLVSYSFKSLMVGRDSRDYLALFLHFLGVKSDNKSFTIAQDPSISVRRAESLCLSPGPGMRYPFCTSFSLLLRYLGLCP